MISPDEFEEISQRRSRSEMVCDILRVVSHGAVGPTKIMRRANLTWRALLSYLDVLIKNGFITREQHGKTATYSLTERGRATLRHYTELRNSLEVLQLDSLTGKNFTRALRAEVAGKVDSTLRSQLEGRLVNKGLELLGNRVRGKSGVEHQFDVVARASDGIIHAYSIAEDENDEHVLSLFAKQLDTDAMVHVLYTRSVTSKAVSLARSYGIELSKWSIEDKTGGKNEELSLTALSGSMVLLEVDPMTRYETLVERLVGEIAAGKNNVHLFSWKGSPVYEFFSEKENVSLKTLSPDVSYTKQVGKRESLVPQGDTAVILDELAKVKESRHGGAGLIVLDSLSDIILLHGVEETYKFVRNAHGLLSGGKVTMVYILKKGSHDERTSSLVKGMFINNLVYDAKGLRSAKTG